METVKNLIFVIVVMSLGFMQDASLQITNYSADTGQLEISMMNSQAVGGIQLQLESSDSTTVVSGASGGSAGDAGFTLSTNSSGTILGFSFSGASIPTSDNMVSLVYVDLTFSDETVFFQLDASSSTLSSTGGTALDADFGETFEVGGTVTLGCTDDSACNYDSDATEDDGSCTYAEENFDCDGNCIVDVDCAGTCGGSLVEDECGVCDGSGIADGACDCDGNVADCAGDCGGSAVEDECGVCDGDGTSCLDLYYNVEIGETGESSLFIFESGIANLSIGDELGVFDSNGVIDSTGAIGEILVGTGIWSGSQLEVVGIQAVDLSQFGGPILPGANEGNTMTLKVWSPSLETEFDVTYTISSGTGTFNGLFTAIGSIEFCEVPEGTCDCDGTLPTQCWDGSTTCNNDCPAYFNVEIAETGESTLFIFQDTIEGLDVGDELGVYDANGTLDSTGTMGEILVGTGVWTGSQLEIVGIQAVDLSQFGGPILPGANESNSMSLKVFKLSDQMTYDVNYGIGSGTGTFNGLFTAIESIEFAPEYTVVINEFFFRANEDVPDYVELFNYGLEDVDLSGWSLTDGEDAFDGSFDGILLVAGGYVLLAGADPFFDANGDELIAGDFGNSLLFDISLSTSSDDILLLDADGIEVDFVSYDSDAGWLVGNDYRGHAVELSDPYSDNNDPTNWGSSDAEGMYMYTEDGDAGEDFGTPGQQNSNYTEPILGCTDDMACNYDATATMDDGSCEYPDYLIGECDCDGNLFDCNGVCGGDSFIDDCGGCVDAETNPDDCLDADNNLPTEFSLSQNYPNPFNPVTSINFDVAQNGKINLDVYDIKGNHISSLISSYYSIGSYAIQWDGVDAFGAEVASGVYIYQLRHSSGLITKKMTLIR